MFVLSAEAVPVPSQQSVLHDLVPGLRLLRKTIASAAVLQMDLYVSGTRSGIFIFKNRWYYKKMFI